MKSDRWTRRDNFSQDAHQRMLDRLDALDRQPHIDSYAPDEPRIGECVVVKITGSVVGGGKYHGRIWHSTDAAVSESTTLADADFGLDPDGTPLIPGSLALVLNALEKGQNTHDLTNSAATNANGFFIGFVRSRNPDPDGRWVVIINGVPWKNC